MMTKEEPPSSPFGDEHYIQLHNNVCVAIHQISLSSVPSLVELGVWAATAIQTVDLNNTEISIRVVDCEEMSMLNGQYRGKHKTTNVLSFFTEALAGTDSSDLADIAICADVVNQEATEQSKQNSAHWAHMLTHGVLHVAGYDHENEVDALEMEALETQILVGQGFSAPYEVHSNFQQGSVNAG